MELKTVQNITFNTDESTVTATLASPNDLVLLKNSGTVTRYNINEQKEEELFTVKSPFTHRDGGFDIDDQSSIYTLGSIVVVVNDFKRHGVVHYPNKYNSLRLWRGEYHADISKFPIALYNDDNGIPHLIYGNDWNHIQIMNLDTRQILTAAKSLIEENAEEDHLEFYRKHEETNKLSWPRPYDYFYGRLEMSPDNKNFLSAGWAWGSCDAYSVYNVDDFINNPRISLRGIGGWEHDNRAVCWINNETVAVAYDPREEGDEGATKDSPNQIHFYQVNEKEVVLKTTTDVAGLNLVHSEMHFNNHLNAIVVVSDIKGVAVVSLAGEVLFHDEEMTINSYNAELNLFLKTDEKAVEILEIIA